MGGPLKTSKHQAETLRWAFLNTNQKHNICMKTEQILTALEAKHQGEKEYLQAVREVLQSIEPVYNEHPEFERVRLVERS